MRHDFGPRRGECRMERERTIAARSRTAKRYGRVLKLCTPLEARICAQNLPLICPLANNSASVASLASPCVQQSSSLRKTHVRARKWRNSANLRELAAPYGTGESFPSRSIRTLHERLQLPPLDHRSMRTAEAVSRPVARRPGTAHGTCRCSRSAGEITPLVKLLDSQDVRGPRECAATVSIQIRLQGLAC